MIQINLAPQTSRKKRRSSFSIGNSNIPLEILVGFGGGFVVLLVCIHILLIVGNIAQSFRHHSLKSQWAQLKDKKDTVDALVTEMRTLQGKSTAIEELTSSQRVLWSQKLNIISDILPKGVWLRTITLEDDAFNLEGSSVSRQNDQIVTIHNFASALKDNAEFLEHFATIEPGSVQRRSINKIEVADFIITGKLK